MQLVELDHALAISGSIGDEPPNVSSWERKRPRDIKKQLVHCSSGFVEVRNSPTSCLGGMSIVLLGYAPMSTICLRFFQDSEQLAIVQVMHRTVREFFLHPHCAVSASVFKVIKNIEEAQKMIQITCVRYLSLHHKELLEKYKQFKDFHNLVRYLESRPFIKYSLECLKSPKTNIHSKVQPLLSQLIMNVQACSPSPAFYLLKQLIQTRTDVEKYNIQEQLNHLLGIAAEEGYVVAASNLLSAGAECESTSKDNCYRALHLAAKNGHHTMVRLLLDHGAAIEARVHLWERPSHLRRNDKELDNSTALHLAARSGHYATVFVLLERGANIEACTRYDPTDLEGGRAKQHELPRLGFLVGIGEWIF
jgi:hypothetical protein